jgi:uncharacterized metal-binding protein
MPGRDYNYPMPSGKTHALATAITGGLLSPALVLFAGQPVTHAVAFAVGCLVGLVVTPDLDVPGGSHAMAIIGDTAGGLMGKVWRLFWFPYARYIIPRHRHPLSHLPVFSTILRLIYLFAVPVLLWYALRLILPLPQLPAVRLLPLSPFMLWAISGLIASDTLHTIMDFFT